MEDCWTGRRRGAPPLRSPKPAARRTPYALGASQNHLPGMGRSAHVYVGEGGWAGGSVSTAPARRIDDVLQTVFAAAPCACWWGWRRVGSPSIGSCCRMTSSRYTSCPPNGSYPASAWHHYPQDWQYGQRQRANRGVHLQRRRGGHPGGRHLVRAGQRNGDVRRREAILPVVVASPGPSPGPMGTFELVKL